MDTKEKELLLHDLQGPILYAKGFHTEIVQSVEQLCTLLPAAGGSVSAPEADQIREIVSEDLKPCLGYLLDVIVKLDSRIDCHSQERDT